MLHIPMDIVNSSFLSKLAHWHIISFLYQSHHVKERLFCIDSRCRVALGVSATLHLDVDATPHLMSMQRYIDPPSKSFDFRTISAAGVAYHQFRWIFQGTLLSKSYCFG